jgi:ABC-type antimicrobial peptide transport system permease subunit
MEIFELILASVELCGCSLDLAALVADVFALISGRRYQRARKARKEGAAVPGYSRFAVVFWILLLVGMILTALVIWRWATLRRGGV